MKKFWKQKTFWAAIGGIATGTGLIIGGNIPEGIVAIIGGIQVIFLRQAVNK